MNRILAMLGWFLLAIILLLLGIIAASQHNTASTGVALVPGKASKAVLRLGEPDISRTTIFGIYRKSRRNRFKEK